jgi:F-type H+-transporting ATPase subunit delta
MKEIIAKRYARALIRIGQEDGQFEGYGEGLKRFQQVLEISAELKEVMENPIYNKEQKKLLFHALNAKLGLPPILMSFILLLIDKRRLGSLADIVQCYDRMVDEVAGRTRARVVSAVPLPEASVEAIRKQLAAMTGKEVTVDVETDPALIGGVVTQIGDIVYDGSLRTQLAQIKDSLMKG